jgi:hypothetical protein
MNIGDFSQAVWRTSTFTNGGAACVEVAQTSDLGAVRDSKNPTGPILIFPATHLSLMTHSTPSARGIPC